MRLKYIFHGKDKEPHLFHVKSDWDPPVKLAVMGMKLVPLLNREMASGVSDFVVQLWILFDAG